MGHAYSSILAAVFVAAPSRLGIVNFKPYYYYLFSTFCDVFGSETIIRISKIKLMPLETKLLNSKYMI